MLDVATLGKVKKTKTSMLVALVILNILATIALLFMMTNSTLVTSGSSLTETIVTLYGFSLNISLVFAIFIAIVWLIVFILFYEMKTDDELENNIAIFKASVDVKLKQIDTDLTNAVDYIDTQKATAPKFAINPDILDITKMKKV